MRLDVRSVTSRARWRAVSESAPMRFTRTEAASAAVLLAATMAALVWANVDADGYARVWLTPLSVRIGDAGIEMSLSAWINSGLMSLFFFVVGLEARQEFDIGELRERRRIVLPVLAGVGGMAAAIGLYLLFTAGTDGMRGWGVAMSTDTAFALGVLALVGPRFPQRLRVFLLTVVVVDDIVALVVIAVAYTERLSPMPLMVAVLLFLGVVLLTRLGVSPGWPYLVLAVAAWLALARSGVDPLVIGLVIGLYAYAAPADRDDLERATDLFRGFREQPTPELARAATVGLRAAVSPNERLREQFHRVTSFVIVPLFALSNAGIQVSGPFLAAAFASPVTQGIVVGYVVGKPLGVGLVTVVAGRLSGGRLRPPVGWLAVTGAGTLAGIGFTVSLLVATLAFRGEQLEQAKVGVLTAALLSALLSWLVFGVARRLPGPTRARLLLGSTDTIEDLAVPVDPERDHVRGPETAPITLVEYGDFECPYCGQVEPVVRELLDEGDLRYVWRHLPLPDVHPHAQLAAEAAEVAGRQGEFWAMHDLLLAHQGELTFRDLHRYAEQLELDVARFDTDVRAHLYAERVTEDRDSAEASGAAGTPSFFINGSRHHGAYDLDTLTRQVQLARVRARLGQR
ncbi:MAG TPA: Na+/H+ antiporter NhaA [Pseudonocardia sp.]|jgi:Na+/H+ antiporter NhaA